MILQVGKVTISYKPCFFWRRNSHRQFLRSFWVRYLGPGVNHTGTWSLDIFFSISGTSDCFKLLLSWLTTETSFHVTPWIWLKILTIRDRVCSRGPEHALSKAHCLQCSILVGVRSLVSSQVIRCSKPSDWILALLDRPFCMDTVEPNGIFLTPCQA